MNTNAVKDIAGFCSSLTAGGYSVRLTGFSAIDLYLGLPGLPFFWAETNADIALLARFIENLRFPGVEIADGAADASDGTLFFCCTDRDEQNRYSIPLLSFSYDWKTRRFLDPLGVYPLLRELRDKRDNFLEENAVLPVPVSGVVINQCSARPETARPFYGRYRSIIDKAIFLARYGDTGGSAADAEEEFSKTSEGNVRESPPEPEIQRALLSCLMVSPRPDRGLDFLKRTGFLSELWPELACFDDVDHSKEFHPEGNVWNHTLETFRYRKTSNGAYDLRLSLGLLLHDAGKPVSASYGSRRFDGHAELGAHAAARFLERLEFDPAIVRDIYYLVRNHMLPAALKRLPVVKTSEIMSSPLFPTLMELYRCDESSSFKGLDSYYENSAAYQTYLKNVRNPYRSPDGKKIGKNNHNLSFGL